MTKVLVVDDHSITNITPVINALTNKGYECKVCQQGSNVDLEVINFKPTMMFVPATDYGFSIVKAVKTNFLTSYIKVFMFVEHQDVDEVLEGFSLGVVDYIPINTSEEDLVRHLEIRTSVEEMYEHLHTYYNSMETLKRKSEKRLKCLNCAKNFS